jgi:hypothetical protein
MPPRAVCKPHTRKTAVLMIFDFPYKNPAARIDNRAPDQRRGSEINFPSSAKGKDTGRSTITLHEIVDLAAMPAMLELTTCPPHW